MASESPSLPTTQDSVDESRGLFSEILAGQGRILSLIAAGHHISRVLDEFCGVVEASIPGTRCCVMIFNPAQRSLSLGAGPRLPSGFRGVLEGLSVGLAPGSCSAAVHRDEVVISGDIDSDPLWEGFREKALEHNLKACWSVPIRSVKWADGPDEEDQVRVLGTVAFYHDSPREAETTDLDLLEIAATLAGLALMSVKVHEKVEEQDLYDVLTSLPNRRLFTEELRNSVSGMSPHEDKLGVLLMDIDHFKEVNDTFGYAVGDFLLRSIAERLATTRKGADLLARFGDDEFIFMVSDFSSNDHFKEIATEILAAVSEPHDFSGQQLVITASLGASLYPWDGEDAQTLMRNAENALQAAKIQGRNRIRLYAPTMGVNAFEKLQLKMALSYAAENDELELLFQPKVASETGEIIGAEALTYWNHPGQGRLSPGKFIPLAEETGLILPIGTWILNAACHQVKAWRSAGFRDFTVAVNISPHQFRERTFVDTVATILERVNLEPEALELEIRETVAMTEVEKTMERLTELRALGLTISIDDFGTGYSSLAYLKRFPIHILKIDRSFVRNLPDDKENRAITKAVIALAHYLDLHLVAEGVETIEQADFLAREGCQYLQGYYFSMPISSRDFTQVLSAGIGREQGKSFVSKPRIIQR
jgi:diguanylate cyclase (GGDEF)-like protein